MTLSVVIDADGGSRGNPGPAGYGAVVRDAVSGEVLAERAESIGTATNNVAEYRGLIAGLRAAGDLGAERVAVRMDSRLVIEQMLGHWRIKHPAMRPLAEEAAALVGAFARVTFQWVPREQNEHADRLANDAMDAAAGRGSSRVAMPRDAPEPLVVPAWTPPSGSPTRLLLVRHGATAHSGERRFSGRNDLPLDEAGRHQAQALARCLGTRTDVAAVISSPLRRAQETADVIAARLGLSTAENGGFAELDFGAWEGLTMAEAARRFPDEMRAWAADPDGAPPGGESVAALAERVRRARDAVIAEFPGRAVVVVTHVTPIKALVRAVLDAPPAALFRMHLDPGSLTVLDHFPAGEARLSLFNDTPQ